MAPRKFIYAVELNCTNLICQSHHGSRLGWSGCSMSLLSRFDQILQRKP